MTSLRNLIAVATLTVVTALAAARGFASPPHAVSLRSLYGLHAPERLSRAHSALVLVDFQEEFLHGKLPLPDAKKAVARASELLEWARRSGLRVVHVQNVASRPGSPVFASGSPTTAIVPELRPLPGEWVVTKSMLGAFSKTELDARFRASGIDTLIVGGLMTHLAVATTASDATALGYRVVVAGDAAATRALPGPLGSPEVDADTLQRAALAAIADRVADVLPARALVELPVVP